MLDTIMLDTTYCRPQYAFPPQRAVLDEVVRCVAGHWADPGVLFLFGAYTIGKERVFMSVRGRWGRWWAVSAPPSLSVPPRGCEPPPRGGVPCLWCSLSVVLRPPPPRSPASFTAPWPCPPRG